MLQTVVDPGAPLPLHQLAGVLVGLPRPAQYALPRHVQHGVRDEDDHVGRAFSPADQLIAEQDLH